MTATCCGRWDCTSKTIAGLQLPDRDYSFCELLLQRWRASGTIIVVDTQVVSVLVRIECCFLMRRLVRARLARRSALLPWPMDIAAVTN